MYFLLFDLLFDEVFFTLCDESDVRLDQYVFCLDQEDLVLEMFSKLFDESGFILDQESLTFLFFGFN